MNVGDKVRFLNAEGGGYVARVEKNLIYVADDDGFEIPVLASEVVVVEQPKAKVAEAPREVEKPKTEETKIAKGSERPQFFLAFTKSDGGNSGFLDLYAINDSDFQAFFTLAEQVGQTDTVHPLHSGHLTPRAKVFLKRYDPNRIDNQLWLCNLILFSERGDYKPIAPASTTIKIRAARFFKENSFVPVDYFDERAILHGVLPDELQTKIDELSQADLHAIARQKEREEQKRQSKKSNINEIVEVDLHIDAILESTVGLSAREMLQVQIARFRHVMDEYMGRKGQRIVFIHGVGSGSLKTEVRKLLDGPYRSCQYQDASFKEYGYGATMVVI